MGKHNAIHKHNLNKQLGMNAGKGEHNQLLDEAFTTESRVFAQWSGIIAQGVYKLMM